MSSTLRELVLHATSVDAFSKLVPVLRHPRCFNCHGNFDIADTNDHSGAAAVPRGLDFRRPLDVPQRQRLHAECGECHNQITGHAKPSDAGRRRNRVGLDDRARPDAVGARNDEQLCILLKGFEENADSFITPDGTRWARLVGDHWTDSRDCGCVKPKVELIMRGEIIGRAEGQAISGEFRASIMLEPDTLSVYQGSGMVTLSNFKMSIPPNCTFSSNVPPSRIAVKELRFDADGGNDISLLIYPDNTSGSHTFTCPGLPRPITMPVVTPMQQWRYVHGRDLRGTDYYLEDFQVTPQASGGRTMVGRKEVIRTIAAQGDDVTAKTVFEIWTVPPQQP